MAKVVLQQKPSWDVLESSPLLIGQLITNPKSGSNTVLYLNTELLMFATPNYNIATFTQIFRLCSIYYVWLSGLESNHWRNSIWLWRCPSDNPGLNCNIQFDAPNIPDRAWGASIPRAIFQGRPCSNDTSLRTQHVLAIPEQAVLSHAEFVRHFITNQTNCGVGVP